MVGKAGGTMSRGRATQEKALGREAVTRSAGQTPSLLQSVRGGWWRCSDPSVVNEDRGAPQKRRRGHYRLGECRTAKKVIVNVWFEECFLLFLFFNCS